MLVLLQSAPVADGVQPVGEMNLWTMATYGGPIMIVLTLMLALAVYMFIERLITLKHAMQEDSSFMNRIKER